MSQKRLKVLPIPTKCENTISIVGLSKNSFKGFRQNLEGSSSNTGSFRNFSSQNLPIPIRDATFSSSRPSKKNHIVELIESKRQILLSKIRIGHKKDRVREIKADMRYREKELTIRAKDFDEDLNMVRKNFLDQKKELELLLEEVDYMEGIKLSKTKMLQEVRNKIFQKENETKNIQERLSGFENYKEFISLVFTHLNRNFNEEVFLECLRTSRVGLRDGFNVEKTWNMVKKKVVETINEPANPFFVTAAKVSQRRSSYHTTEILTHLHNEFSEMLSIIEKDHLELFKDIQIEEANIIDITNEINK
jgi:hypothetical protein